MRTLIVGCLGAVLLIVFGCKDAPHLPVDHVDLHYVPWDILSITRLSCSDVVESDHASEIRITDKASIEKISLEVFQQTFHEVSGHEAVDARICLILRTERGDALEHVAFARYHLMSIGDKVYRTDSKLFKCVLSFLPDDYLPTDIGKYDNPE